MRIFETEIKVRYAETDQMGVVHHSRYYPWFEVARTELFEEIGYDYAKLEEEGFMFPIVESYCKYKKAVKYPEVLIIRTLVESFNGVKIGLKYEVIRKEDKTLMAEGKTVHGVIDKAFRLVNLKKKKPELYQLMLDILMPADGASVK